MVIIWQALPGAFAPAGRGPDVAWPYCFGGQFHATGPDRSVRFLCSL